MIVQRFDRRIEISIPILKGYCQVLLIDRHLTPMKGYTTRLTIRAWVNRSERLQGEPLVQGALTSQTPDGIHFG